MARFPIGFWNYTTLEHATPEAVDDWHALGITLAMGSMIDADDESLRQQRRQLDRAADLDMPVIVWVRELIAPALARDGEEAYRAAFARALAALGDHPALHGFVIGDEPEHGAYEAFCQAIRIQMELAPHLNPFGNLLPISPRIEDRVGFLDWSDYLDAYARHSGTRLLSYDCYAQCQPDAENDGGHDFYFANLREFQAAAVRHGVDWWTTLASMSRYKWRRVSEDLLRWQLHTAVAHGANGVQWFYLYEREPHSNSRGAPFDEHYERTDSFAWLSRVNRTFLSTFGDLFTRLELQHVRHVGRAWGGVPLLDAVNGDRIGRAEGGNLTVSQFRHRESGAIYVAIVNNSQTDDVEAKVWLRGKAVKLHHVRWGGQESLLAPPPECFDFARFTHRLSPGQMEVLRIESSSDKVSP